MHKHTHTTYTQTHIRIHTQIYIYIRAHIQSPVPQGTDGTQFVVTVDEALEAYLRGGGMLVELHHARGTDFRTVAAATVSALLGKHA